MKIERLCNDNNNDILAASSLAAISCNIKWHSTLN
jgi:hypothetical protein